MNNNTKRMILYLIPLVIFLLIAGFLLRGLSLDPREIPSPLISKTAPDFELPTLFDEEKKIRLADMQGKVWILNIWASWCDACRTEHRAITTLSLNAKVPMIGLNYKDQPENAKVWLSQFGNPYTTIANDSKGKVGIDWGVYGVPETFVIDKKGIVRYKHIGPITEKKVENHFLPMIKKLREENS